MADYTLRQRWCLAVGAPVARNDLRELGGWDREGVARARGADEIEQICTTYLAELGLTDRATLMAWARGHVHAPTALGLAQVVVAMGWATWANWLSDDEAFQVIFVAGKLAQSGCPSWEAFGAACEGVRDEVRVLWAELPWTTELDIALFTVAVETPK